MGGPALADRPTTADSDNACVDTSQLAAIYREHARFVGRSLRRLGVVDAHLDDLVQDVFLVVHRRLNDFDPRYPMRSWLYGIARGVAANYRRGCERMRRGLALVDERAPPASGSRHVEALEAADVLERFMEGLDEAHRELFVLSEVEGFTGPEIARALGLNLNTVYARIRKTRRSFDRMLERHDDEGRRR